MVFFNIRGKEQHAGIFMGDNRFIHASTSVGVTQSSLDGFYWRDRGSPRPGASIETEQSGKSPQNDNNHQVIDGVPDHDQLEAV